MKEKGLMCLPFRPLSRMRNFLKTFLFGFFVPSGGHTNTQAGIPIALSSSVALVLSGHCPHSITQLFIILISSLPFPSSLYLSLSPRIQSNTPHTHFLRPARAESMAQRGEFQGKVRSSGKLEVKKKKQGPEFSMRQSPNG